MLWNVVLQWSALSEIMFLRGAENCGLTIERLEVLGPDPFHGSMLGGFQRLSNGLFGHCPSVRGPKGVRNGSEPVIFTFQGVIFGSEGVIFTLGPEFFTF